MSGDPFERVRQLCRDEAAARNPKMEWMWGAALFGYALSELDALTGADEFTAFLQAYCDYWVAHPPVMDYADRVAPALITYAMQKKTGNLDYARLTERALDYIRHEPRLISDAVNHLGKSPEARWYPRSIWVDSLMMFSVFPARYAAENGDWELLDFAARQPRIYSRYMQDSGAGLWYHSYWVRAGRHHPKGKVFWGRGNGWVVCALPMIMDEIGSEHQEFEGIRAILNRTAEGVIPWQNPDGSFRTIINKPSYRELSATALIAAGILHGVRRGYLDRRYRGAGERAFSAVTKSIYEDSGRLSLPEISAPTIPLHILPSLCYRLTPRGKNWSYGIAAAAFASVQYRLLQSGEVRDV
ncbi:MAG: glycoside hydrolase family 88 protein [Clostridiales bacterium]|jgi:unsaturated rhamnogalacturonyl hydrolase|nr:glycoside hydrolase family 88 protein [Clostridiales bacterium]